jgi:hypothetical protein
VRRGRVFVQNSQGFETIDVRQIDVHQDYLRRLAQSAALRFSVLY